MEMHGGKTKLTFLDSNKDYKLYDEQNRVVTTQKGTELYTHYDKVESSVRECYEKVQKALAVGVPKATILTYFYPEVTVEKMSSYRKKQ